MNAPHRPEHGHNDEEADLRLLHRYILEVRRDLKGIMATLAILRTSAGATQGGAEEILRQMATLTEQLETLKTDFDEGTTKLGGDVRILIDAFKAGGPVTPAQQAALDGLRGISTKLNDLDAETVAAVATEPPVTPPTP